MKIGPELIEDGEMFRVRWPDGEITDMVNKTRAKEAIRRYLESKGRIDRRMPGRALEKARGAFK